MSLNKRKELLEQYMKMLDKELILFYAYIIILLVIGAMIIL